MKTNCFLVLLLLFPLVLSSCSDDDDDNTGKIKTFKVKYEIVPVNQEDYGVEATGGYREYKKDRLYSAYLCGAILQETDLNGKTWDIDIEGDRATPVNLPWSYESTVSNVCPPMLACTAVKGIELILRVYIDGALYKEERQRSPAGFECLEFLEL